jgi:DDE family transposase
MEANMQLSTTNCISFLDQIFNEEKCFELAKKTKFIVRSSSRIKGHELLKVLILPSESVTTDSLVGLCDRIIQFNPNADISASALCQRINHISSVKFIQVVFEELLNLSRKEFAKQYEAENGLLGYFKNVYIQDSTLFELNECHSKKYKGTRRGTNCCKSQVKIDLIHNYSTGLIIDIGILAGKTPDQGLAERIYKHLCNGDLIIRDLGYFAVEHIKRIQDISAYYLSRLPSNVLVFLNPNDKQPIDLEKYVKENHPNDSVINFPEIYISAKKIKTRLVIYLMPQEEIEKRLRRANKHAKETGRIPSKAKKSLMKFSIFITNIPDSVLSKEVIGTIYRLRWEIELIFKQWKSKLNIHYLKGTNKNRIDCLIWARMCMVIIAAILIATFMKIARDIFHRELSAEKLLNFLIRQDKFSKAIETKTLEFLVKKIIKNMPKMLMKDKRTLKTMREMSISSLNYYECAA